MNSVPPPRTRTRLVSFVIVSVLGLQAIAALALTPGPIEEPPFMWPCLNYPMYSVPRYEATGIQRLHVVATTSEGRELEVTHDQLGTTRRSLPVHDPGIVAVSVLPEALELQTLAPAARAP